MDISGGCGSGAVVKVYKNGSLVGTAVTNTTSWTYEGLAVSELDNIYVTAKEGTNCEVASATVVVGCSGSSVTPVIDTPVYAGDDVLTGSCGSGAEVEIFQDNVSIGLATVTGTDWSIAVTGLVANTTEFYAEATEAGFCTAVSLSKTALAVPTTALTGSYCGETTEITGSLSASSGILQLYKEGTPDVAVGDPFTLNNTGDWTVTGIDPALMGGDDIYAVATLTNGSVSTSDPITIGNKTDDANIPVITSTDLYEGDDEITGTGIHGDEIYI